MNLKLLVIPLALFVACMLFAVLCIAIVYVWYKISMGLRKHFPTVDKQLKRDAIKRYKEKIK